MAYSFDPFAVFWSSTIPSHFLESTQSYLTSLTLHSNQAVGYEPLLDLQHLHFPYLSHLSLRLIAFTRAESRKGIDGFIIQHKATLEKLELHACPMVIPSQGSKRVWSDVWTIFQTELDNLMDITVSRDRAFDDELGEDDETKDLNGGYMTLIAGWGYCPYVDTMEEARDDEQTLQSLLAVVRARKMCRYMHDD